MCTYGVLMQFLLSLLSYFIALANRRWGRIRNEIGSMCKLGRFKFSEHSESHQKEKEIYLLIDVIFRTVLIKYLLTI